MGRSSQPETAYAAWSSPVPLPSAVRTTSKLPEVFVISIEVTSLGSSEVSEMLSLLSSSDTAEEDDSSAGGFFSRKNDAVPSAATNTTPPMIPSVFLRMMLHPFG